MDEHGGLKRVAAWLIAWVPKVPIHHRKTQPGCGVTTAWLDTEVQSETIG